MNGVLIGDHDMKRREEEKAQRGWMDVWAGGLSFIMTMTTQT